MLKIIIIDDDKVKTEAIKSVIKDSGSVSETTVDVAETLIEARNSLSEKQYDLAIIDIKLPHRLGGQIDDLGGVHLIEELRHNQSLCCPFHIIGLTAHEDSFEVANPEFTNNLWCLIKYDISSIVWRNNLERKISYLHHSQSELSRKSDLAFETDVAVVTALHDPELKAVLNLLDEVAEVTTSNDSSTYYKGRIRGTSVSVVAACSGQMGIAPASVLSMKLISRFRPRILGMVGIAAGMKSNHVNLGDILIAEHCWDYESGKKNRNASGETEFEPDPRMISISVELRDAIAESIRKEDHFDEIRRGWPYPIDTPLKAHLGPFATGASVVADGEVSEVLKRRSRKIIGIDMECFGVYCAGLNCSKPRPLVVSMKSACDYADAGKDDGFQPYAAYTSASYFFKMCNKFLGEQNGADS